MEGGQRRRLVYEAGEGVDQTRLIAAGGVSNPLCGRRATTGYRMTINVSLANACKNCLRVYRARRAIEGGGE